MPLPEATHPASMKNVALWIARLLLGGTFAYAAAQKIIDPSAFATDIEHFRLLPHPLTLALALYLPWLELLCSAGLLVPRFERAALVLLTVLCGIFFVALTSAWLRGLDINCGCFGHSTTPSALPWAIARSAVLGLMAVFLFKQSRPVAAQLS